MNDKLEINSEFCDIMKETLEVLKNVDNRFFERLPEHIKECLLKYSENSKKLINLDMTKKINEQISEECKDLLSVIYYICCEDEVEKKELLESWNKNMKL